MNELAFFTHPRGRRKVRQALIQVLSDPTATDEVRGWAAERLHLHISQETVRACVRAAEDPSPEVRLWAVYTLALAATSFGTWQPHPLYRDLVAPVVERALADTAVVPGWWAVCREAQAHLPLIHGSAEEAARLHADNQNILNDPAATREDKDWARFNEP